jgi:hypothetical protein
MSSVKLLSTLFCLFCRPVLPLSSPFFLLPSEPAIRRSLLALATSALFLLVQRFPSVAFHQRRQLFAVSSGVSAQCVIIVYDLRTATRWRILEGCKSEATAIAFNQSGALLASYAALEQPPAVRVWSTATEGLLAGLMGSSGKALHEFRFPVLQGMASEPSRPASSPGLGMGPISQGAPLERVTSVLKSVRLEWEGEKRLILTREDNSEQTINLM